jgi:hypothetical protein
MSTPGEQYHHLTLEEALDDRAITDPEQRRVHRLMSPYLQLLDVTHLGYDGQLRQGQLVVHEAMHPTFTRIFEGLLELQYPIEKVRPMVEYGWSDALAMADNNTSVYRPDFIVGENGRRTASEHTRGTAADLNPFDNPLLNYNGTLEPENAIGREPHEPAVISGNQAVINLFSEHNMEYGGYWPLAFRGNTDFYGTRVPWDRHHFELRPKFLGKIAVPDGIWRPAA